MSTGEAARTKSGSGPSILWAVLLIILGILAIALPLATSVGMLLLIGWLIIFSGLAQVFYAWHSKGVGSTIWKLLVALLYMAFGFYFLRHPILGVATLTLLIAIFLVAEGVVELIAYFKHRSMGASGWVLLNALITLILGVMIWRHWPFSSLWVVGTLVGISMLMTGTTRLMLARAARR